MLGHNRLGGHSVAWRGARSRLGDQLASRTDGRVRRDSQTVRHKHCTAQTMAANSEAEFRMMFLLNNMDINQEGQLSNEDRLFSSGTPRYQSENSQVNKNLFNTFDIKL